MMLSVALTTLGCKVNQADSEAVAISLRRAGCRVVPFDGPADAYLVNTCTVTHVAERKSRQMLRQARRRNPHALLVATGCAASLGQIAADLVLAASSPRQVADRLLGVLQGRRVSEGPLAPEARPRTRGFLKVQDGCQHGCRYCIVPLARGAERSVPPEQVLAQVQERVDAGFQEIVLTGPRLGAYGRDQDNGCELTGLVQAILSRTCLPRLRLSSLEPQDFPLSLLELWPNPRLCRHFHLPLQSGSDRVLGRMERGYTTVEYAELVQRIRRRVPEAAITSDVIVGFPGETAAEFEESLAYVERVQFARLHVFRFSRRPGTAAAQMPHQVSESVKRSRGEALLGLAARQAQSFVQGMVGHKVSVVFERRAPDGLWEGLTDNYLRVRARCAADLANQILSARLATSGGELALCPTAGMDMDWRAQE